MSLGKRKRVRKALRRLRFVLLVVLVSAVVVPGSALVQNEARESGLFPRGEGLNIDPRPYEEELVPGQVIVKYKEGVGPTTRRDVRRSEGLEKNIDLGLIRAEVDKVKGQSVEQA